MDLRKKLEEYKNLNIKSVLMTMQLGIYLTMILIQMIYKNFCRSIKIFYGLVKIKKIHTIKFAFKI